MYDPSTKVFDGSNRQLLTVPGKIPAATVELKLSSNKITKLQANVFSFLAKCNSITLINNFIAEIETGAFSGLRSLRHLNLMNNKLTALKDGMFIGLSNLESLSIYNNSLETIGSGTFRGMHSLNCLRLGENCLKTLDQRLFDNVTRPFELFLDDEWKRTKNITWQCSALCWLKQEHHEGKIKWMLFGTPLEQDSKDHLFVLMALSGINLLVIKVIQAILLNNIPFPFSEQTLIFFCFEFQKPQPVWKKVLNS